MMAKLDVSMLFWSLFYLVVVLQIGLNRSQEVPLIDENPEMIRQYRSAFFNRHNSSDKYVIESKERPAKNQTKHSFRPRFAVPRDSEFKFSPEYMCSEQYSPDCRNRTRLFRQNVVREFSKMIQIHDERVNEQPDREDVINIYNVSFKPLGQLMGEGPKKPTICHLKKFKLKMLRRKDFASMRNVTNLGKFLPKIKIFPDNQKYASCVVVSSGGSLFRSNLGDFIDTHDIVMRFNHAPTNRFEDDVGTKTSIRVINSQVIFKDEFNFLDNPLFQNITIAAWDPGRYKSSLKSWVQSPDFDLFANYKAFLSDHPDANFQIVDPRKLWKLWEILQSYFPNVQIRRNPPSSGFIGIAMLIPYCEIIDVVEYIPSTRMTGRCHYYENEFNPMCTFGSWHPLSAEKLFVLDMNSVDDYTTFQKGILRIRTSSDNSNNC